MKIVHALRLAYRRHDELQRPGEKTDSFRLFFQGRIAAMAGEGRQALPNVIDDVAQVGALHRGFEEAKRTCFMQRARLGREV